LCSGILRGIPSSAESAAPPWATPPGSLGIPLAFAGAGSFGIRRLAPGESRFAILQLVESFFDFFPRHGNVLRLIGRLFGREGTRQHGGHERGERKFDVRHEFLQWLGMWFVDTNRGSLDLVGTGDDDG